MAQKISKKTPIFDPSAGLDETGVMYGSLQVKLPKQSKYQDVQENAS